MSADCPKNESRSSDEAVPEAALKPRDTASSSSDSPGEPGIDHQMQVVEGLISDYDHSSTTIGPFGGEPRSTGGEEGPIEGQCERAVTTAFHEAQSLLKTTIAAIGATSCTLYVRDPMWDELRLVFMPGVRHTEPMYGVTLPCRSKGKVSEGPSIQYFSDVNAEAHRWILREKLSPELEAMVARNPLFGDFVGREGVRSCARLIYYENDIAQATLFVNFSEPRDFENTPETRNQIETLFEQLKAFVPALRSRLVGEDRSALGRLAKILQPIEELSTLARRTAQDAGGTSLQNFFEVILKTAMEAFEIDPNEGLGTIHRYRPESGILEPYTCRGVIDTNPPPRHAVASGDAIITWVAAKRMAILIDDIENSAFRNRVYFALRKGIRSELAVPMLAHGELLGVLNLESTHANAFSPSDLRTAWYAAKYAAVGYQLYQEALAHRQLAERTQQVLVVSHKAAVLQRTVPADDIVRPTMALFAELLITWTRQWQPADWCDIWRWDADKTQFTEAGASYAEFESMPWPRHDGWTEYVHSRNAPIWISNIRSVSEFDPYKWDKGQGKWVSIRDAPDIPRECNERLLSLKVACELGVPFQVSDQSVAVGWAKYAQPIGDQPTRELMEAIQLLAGNIGLVVDAVHQYAHEWERAQIHVQSQIERIVRHIFRPLPEIPGIEIAAVTHPCGAKIGGDVYTFVRSDTDRTRVLGLLGDAEDHGIPAALRAIPVFAVFRDFAKQVSKPVALLEKMGEVAQDLEISTSALAFLIDLDPKGPWIFGSSAGHPPLMVINRTTLAVSDFPNPNNPAFTFPLFGSNITPRFVCDEWRKLERDDVLIGYSDGVFQATDGKEEFGKDGILGSALRLLREHKGPKEIAEGIYQAARDHAGKEIDDDATVIVMKLKETWATDMKKAATTAQQ